MRFGLLHPTLAKIKSRFVMIKSIVLLNENKTDLRITVEPIADQVFIRLGESAEFFVEVQSPTSDFEVVGNEDDITLYLPRDFGEVKVSLNGGEVFEL